MKTIKSIQQYATTYTIIQQGNCSYRVVFTPSTGDAVKHVPTIFNSVKDAEDYIATCKSMDFMAAQSSK